MGGNPLYNKDTGLSNFNSKEMKNLVGMAYRMMKIDESAPTHEDSVIQKLTQESMFLSGRCAMTIGPWIIRSVKDEANFPHDFTTAFAPYPVEDKNSQNYSQVRLGDYLSVSPYSKYKEESWEFVKWYTTEGILPLVEGGRIPAYKGFDVKEITEILLKNGGNSIDRESAVRVLIEPKDDYAVATNTNKLSRLYHISNDMFEKIMTDEVGIEEGIKEAQKKGDEVLR
jgi:multiple sugar transport system substrate-binding protein